MANTIDRYISEANARLDGWRRRAREAQAIVNALTPLDASGNRMATYLLDQAQRDVVDAVDQATRVERHIADLIAMKEGRA